MRIYLIRNTINNKVYIGQTTLALESRFGQHKKRLLSGTHHNQHLQHSWNKHGSDCWQIELLAECSSLEELNESEIFFIKQYNSTDNSLGYNIRYGGDGGGPHSTETRKKLRELSVTQWERDRDKLVSIRKSQWTPEYREKMKNIMLERWKDDEYLTKQLKTRRSDETRQKLADAAKKNKHKTSESVKARWEDEEYKRRVSQTIKDSNTPEVRKKRSLAIQQAYTNPIVLAEHKKRMQAIMKHPEVRDKISNGLSKYFGKVEGPDGTIYEVTGLRRFCREHNLQYSAFRNLKYNPNKTYKGWKFLHEDNH